MWLLITLLAYACLALANLGDKLVVSRLIPKPIIYATYVGFIQVIAIILIPFGAQVPSAAVLTSALCSGGLFILSIFFLYTALQQGEATRVIPIIGATTPLSVVIFARLLLGEELAIRQYIAIALLIVGVVVITYQRASAIRSAYIYIGAAVASGVGIALTHTIAKYVYEQTSWVNGFFWMRMGSVLVASMMLIAPRIREAIRADLHTSGDQSQKASVVLLIQTVGGSGFVLLNYTISLTSVSIVNALQAIQYIFIFIGSAVLGKFILALRESWSPAILAQKIFATVIILYGVYLLTSAHVT